MRRSQLRVQQRDDIMKTLPEGYSLHKPKLVYDRQHFLQTAEPSFCCFAASALPGFARNSSLSQFRLGYKDKQRDLSGKTPGPALQGDSFGGPTPLLIGPQHDSR